MAQVHSHSFNPVPLRAAMVLVLLSMLVIGVSRLTGIGFSHVPDAEAVAVRELRFEDRPDGSIAVIDARAGRELDTVAPGSNGFLRGTLRGLARERKRMSLGPEIPFRLLGRSDGRLTLEDPATGRRVDLESFGPTNAAVFARLLALAGAGR
jgi:putative photosynthetic complex assembly protein